MLVVRLAADIRTTLIALSNLGLLGVAHGGVAGLNLEDALAECQPRLGFSRAPGLLRFRHGFPLKSGPSVAPAVRQRTPVDHHIVPSAKARQENAVWDGLPHIASALHEKRSLAQGLRQEAVTARGAVGRPSGGWSTRDAAAGRTPSRRLPAPTRTPPRPGGVRCTSAACRTGCPRRGCARSPSGGRPGSVRAATG